MIPVEIKPNVWCLAAVDWNIKNFHGYSVSPKGTTYNAYIIKGEKTALVDTVAHKFLPDFLHGIRKICPLESIDYIIVNHLEPDHSGCLPDIVDLIKPEKILCSKMGLESMMAHYHYKDWPVEAVDNGGSLDLGGKTVHFMEVRMLHWPDSMVSYVAEDKLLLSSDAFGQNIASTERFDDQLDISGLLDLAGHYYANIVIPYSPLVLKVLDKVKASGMEIDMIAPDHGAIWRTHADKIIAAYARWAAQKDLAAKAVITYDTMWQSTERMAKAIADGLLAEGVDARIMSLKSYHHSDVMGELLDAAAFIVGSPTHNNTILPLVADVLTYVKGLRPANRIGAAFGSYGWSGESPKIIAGWLAEMKMEMVDPLIRVKFAPGHPELAECAQLGRNVAAAVKAKLGRS